MTVGGGDRPGGDGASTSIKVPATSADGSQPTQSFTIAINDVNEFAVSTPTDNNAAANAVDENAAVGTAGRDHRFAHDADATTNAVTYSLSTTMPAAGSPSTPTGVVTVGGGDRPEAIGASTNITVRRPRPTARTADQAFTIAINDVNEFAVRARPTATPRPTRSTRTRRSARWSGSPPSPATPTPPPTP